jgi:hypothetical protein
VRRMVLAHLLRQRQGGGAGAKRVSEFA